MPAKLKLTYADCQLLARALNCCKPALHFDAAQQAALPALGRKLASYLAEPNYRANPKPPKQKKLIGFALTRAPGSEWHQTRGTLGFPPKPTPEHWSLERQELQGTFALLRGEGLSKR